MKWDAFSKNFNRLLKDALDDITSKKNLKDKGDDLADDIVKRTKLGLSVDKPEGTPKKLKPLKPQTKTSRRYLKKKGKLSKDTTPAKSNLTQSGDLLDSVHAKVSDKKISVKVSNSEKDKVKWTGKDRPFLNADKNQIKQIKKDLEDELVRQLKKNLK